MAPKVIRLHSENNDFQRIEVLKRNRYRRHQYRQFFVEGVEPINKAVEYGWPVFAFVYSGERRLSDWAKRVLQDSSAEVHYEISAPMMDAISDKEDASELVAVLHMPTPDTSRIPVGPDLLVVVFDRPSNHGNLGTLIRSCNSFKADALVITGHSVDLYEPAVIRASLGSFFAMPLIRLDSQVELMHWITGTKATNSDLDLQVVGTSVKTDTDIADRDFTKPTIIVIGNETYGMSRGYREACDSIVRIPIYGSASSLNVSCAASIVLYEVDRQRRKR